MVEELHMKKFFFASCLIVLIISFTIPASAASVPWTTEDYFVYTQGITTDDGLVDTDEDPAFPPSAGMPPLSASAEAFHPLGGASRQNAGGTSDIPDTASMSVAAWGYNTNPMYPSVSGVEATAWAKYYGEYTATQPVFQINYDLTWDMSANTSSAASTAYDEVFAWLIVADLDNGMTYYHYDENDPANTAFFYKDVFASGVGGSSSDSGNIAGTINVPVTVGHNIKVSFGIQQGALEVFGAGNASSTFDLVYSVAVVPEPVSATLFVVGAAAFVFMRIRKKFRK